MDSNAFHASNVTTAALVSLPKSEYKMFTLKKESLPGIKPQSGWMIVAINALNLVANTLVQIL